MDKDNKKALLKLERLLREEQRQAKLMRKSETLFPSKYGLKKKNKDEDYDKFEDDLNDEDLIKEVFNYEGGQK